MGDNRFLILAMVSIFLIVLTVNNGERAISAAAVSLYIESSQSGTAEANSVCGNKVCESMESLFCPSDCPHDSKEIYTIKLIHVLIIMLIMAATILIVLLLRRQEEEEWPQEYRYQIPNWQQPW